MNEPTRSFAIRWFLVTVLSVLQPAPARSAAPGPSSSPQHRYGVKVELVTVFATVRDGKGKLVTDLDQGDFVLYDNESLQPISRFSREYQPLSVVILLDTSFSMSGRTLDHAKRALEQFLRRLDRRDEVMLMTFRTQPVVVQEFTRDLNPIKRCLRELRGSGSTALYDAILAALDESRHASNRRSALLLISDGINTYGRAQLEGTIMQLRSRDTELFAIGLESGLPSETHSGQTTKAILDELTRSAGGEAFIAKTPGMLGGICDMISDRLHNQYMFSYYPPRTVDGEWRRIRIESRTPGYTVVASKTGYFPGAPAP